MLVYGDCRRIDSARRVITALRARLARRPTSGSVAAREWATNLLIETGELIQGLLDALGARDETSCAAAPDDLLRDLALDVARLYLATEPEIAARVPPPAHTVRSVERALARLARSNLPAQVEIRAPEGYAYYAVYPVLYAMAARELEAWDCSWVVLGIRSIGTSLGAVVAAAAGTDQLYFLRPTGPPFRRVVSFDPSLEQALVAHERLAHYAVVDEGPGLSGSSFGAVADWLQRHGVSSGRIHFFPSHAGDLGPQASAPHRARWKRAHRCYCAFETYFDEARLRSAVFDGLPGEIRDISAGRWRPDVYPDPAAWPPVHPGLERRKYLLRSKAHTRVAKFVGLGAYGRAQVERALLLHDRGFIPEPLAYRNGFLISTWHGAATALDHASVARDVWLARAGRYLAFLASSPRVASAGASPEELLNMACINIGEALGREAATFFENRWRGRLGIVAAASAPVAIDGRLHPWEWLALPDGRLLKADALEHHADHGLVGCQDLAWDLAGLRIEHALTAFEYEQLLETLAETSSYRSHREKETFFACCYLAYQMGYYALAADAADDAAEQRRSWGRRDFYADHLRDLLERGLQP
jgi:hypothetical protein